jgi:F0F1-type ATP synthase delta subunit
VDIPDNLVDKSVEDRLEKLADNLAYSLVLDSQELLEEILGCILDTLVDNLAQDSQELLEEILGCILDTLADNLAHSLAEDSLAYILDKFVRKYLKIFVEATNKE